MEIEAGIRGVSRQRQWDLAALAYPLSAGVILAGCVLLHYYPPATLHLPPCVFHEITGLYCPGCGTARAIHHLMNLEFATALRCNALFVAALPVLAYLFAARCFKPLGQMRLPVPVLSASASWTLTAIVLAWWIARNLPFACFQIPAS
jgi:hypothetical protein